MKNSDEKTEKAILNRHNVGSPKRILMVLNSVNINGGVQNKIMDIYRNINRELVQFDFFILSNSNDTFEAEINSLGGKVFYFKRIREKGTIPYLIKLFKLLREKKYSGVHSYLSNNDGVILLVAKLAGIRIRISHSRGIHIDKGYKKGIFPILKWLISISATKQLACSTLAGKFLYGNNNFEVIRNPINNQRFLNVTQLEVDELKNKIGVKNKQLILGHIGRFSYEKNHNFLLSVAKILKEKSINFLIVLVGDGELRGDFEKKVKENSLSSFFYFAGNQSNVESYYQIFDFLLFPSYYEGFGNVALEAQTAGKKVIASKGVSKEVDIELNLIKFLSIEDIDSWIEAILDHTIQDNKVAKDSISDALNSKGFGIESIINKYYDIYDI